MATPKITLTSESVLDFGKHKGKTIDWIAENEPGYIVWMSQNIDRFEIDDDIVTAAYDDNNENEYESEWEVTGAGDQP